MSYDPNDPNQDSQAPDTTSQTLAQQAASLTKSIASGQVTPAQAQASLPSNTKIVNGVVVPNDPSMLPLFIMAAAVAAPFAVQTLTTLAAGSGAAAGSASGAIDAAAGNTIPAAFGQTAVDTVGGSLLPSSALPAAGAITGAPASVPSGAIGATSSAGLPDWLKSASDVGTALSGYNAGAAQGRNLDNQANAQYANAQNTLYNSELAAPGKIAGNAVRGDILSNARDVSIAAPSDIPVPQISGGLRPSMFSPTTRALGNSITANAAATPMPVATPPTLQPMETAGTGTNILNSAALIASLAKPAAGVINSVPWGQIF